MIILAHVGVGAGGFVGVDMFFVISGYLIHRDLVGRMTEHRLSVRDFYARRLRRILPALYVVTAVTLIVATFVMLPGELDETARAALGAVLFVPNMVDLAQSGYFDHDAIFKPLLHEWSLGVEAQFYIFAPLLPLALRHVRPTRRLLLLVGLFALALVVCVGIRMQSRNAAFFLMPSRAFEFLIGCMLAEGSLPAIKTPWRAEATTGAAMVALTLTVVTVSSRTPLPGLLSLVPCIATAAIIHVGLTRRTAVADLLGRRAPVFVGLISYSIYLWHWPIIVFAHYLDVPDVYGPPVMLSLLAIVSVLSWRYVEVPFRSPAARWWWSPVLFTAGASALATCSLVLLACNGLPGRFPPAVASVASYYSYAKLRPFREGECFITSRESVGDFKTAKCLALVPSERNVLIVGDSHAAHLWAGFRDTWPGVNMLQATASGCKPVFGTVGAERCTSLMKMIFEDFLPTHHLDAIVIAGLWDEADIARLESTVKTIKPYVGDVIVFGPMPRYDEPVATLIAKGMMRDDLESVSAHQSPNVKPLDKSMKAALGGLATYVSPYDTMCPRGRCELFAAAGVPMQFDYHHLTREGSDRLIAEVRDNVGRLF